MKKKKKTMLWLLIPLLLLLLAAAGYLAWKIWVFVPEPEIPALVGSLEPTAAEPAPETETGQMLETASRAVWSAELTGTCSWEKRQASQDLTVQSLDREKLLEGMAAEVDAILARKVEEAVRSSEVYDENLQYRPEVLRAAFREALAARLEHAEDYQRSRVTTLYFQYADRQWQLSEPEHLAAFLAQPLQDLDAAAEELYAAATAAPSYVPKHYVLAEDVLVAPTPDPACYGETNDPAEVQALLETAAARGLIGEEKTVWNADLARIPDTTIRYYLDETLLVLVWQEREARGVGTFAEIFTADGSQLRRRIAGDTPYDLNFMTTSEFAQNSNAVLCLGGDFYHHDRACGICVYQRQIIRFDPDTCDSCYITTDGDMLFSYQHQFKSQAEAQRFVEENDVWFSLGFGPVLIDNGEDVCPYQYRWGEVNEEYARSGLGMLGRHHYLTVNLNCGQPGTEYYYLATLRQLADAMISRGCVKAYTLDGGQTATTVFHGTLVNPVQFGWEKPISDVIYFATALPEAG